jgi:hypothetical protein
MILIKNPKQHMSYGAYNYSTKTTTIGVVDEKKTLVSSLWGCRDFVQDAYCELFTGTNGYFDEIEDKESFLSQLRFLVSYSDDEDKVSNVLDFIHQVEKTFNSYKLKSSKIKLTKLHPCSLQKSDKKWVLLVADKKWLMHPTLCSMFTLSLRSTHEHDPSQTWKETIHKIVGREIKTREERDAGYWKNCCNNFVRIVECSGEVFLDEQETNWKMADVASHGGSGIVAVKTGLYTQIKTDEELKKYGLRFDGKRLDGYVIGEFECLE